MTMQCVQSSAQEPHCFRVSPHTLYHRGRLRLPSGASGGVGDIVRVQRCPCPAHPPCTPHPPTARGTLRHAAQSRPPPNPSAPPRWAATRSQAYLYPTAIAACGTRGQLARVHVLIQCMVLQQHLLCSVRRPAHTHARTHAHTRTHTRARIRVRTRTHTPPVLIQP